MSREQSVEVIHLDVLRTFPTLGFFQDVSHSTAPIDARTHAHFINKQSATCNCDSSVLTNCITISLYDMIPLL